ncbi:MAG: hypothetical protein NY202_05430 [Mollicutes bacterium UO1]
MKGVQKENERNYKTMNEKEINYLLNTKQQGEATQLLGNLTDKSVSLVFFDPQYEKVGDVSRTKD